MLKLAGLLRDRPEGRLVHCSVEPQGLAPLIDWMLRRNDSAKTAAPARVVP
jgi:hypothetical protein